MILAINQVIIGLFYTAIFISILVILCKYKNQKS